MIKSFKPSIALFAFLLFSPCEAIAASNCGGQNWVRVSADCPLPDNLKVGDKIEIAVGSAVSARQEIVAINKCDGEAHYLTSTNTADCGWRQAIIAYQRTDTAVNALKVP